MARSQRLRLRDIRGVYELIGECCELGADPLAWRQHIADQLPELFGCQLGMYSEYGLAPRPFEEPFWLLPKVMIDAGWPSPGDRRGLEAHLKTGRPEEGPHVTPDLLQRKLKVFHWSGDLGRSGWLSSYFFNEYVRHCFLDDGLFAHCRLPSGTLRWMFVNTALKDRPFDERDRRKMKLFNLELARQSDARLAPLERPSVTDLPLRLREVLVCLMEGDSEKQVASRLAISQHTVHGYVKQLHLRFGVSSRGELLSCCRSYWTALRNGN